jgi:hypothetical protein
MDEGPNSIMTNRLGSMLEMQSDMLGKNKVCVTLENIFVQPEACVMIM